MTTENQSATFECRISINYPEITLTWYKGTQKLDNSDKYSIRSVGERHYLQIHSCQTKDEGSYRVVCGPHISNAKLTVAGKTCGVCLHDLSAVSVSSMCLHVRLLYFGAGSQARVSSVCFVPLCLNFVEVESRRFGSRIHAQMIRSD